MCKMCFMVVMLCCFLFIKEACQAAPQLSATAATGIAHDLMRNVSGRHFAANAVPALGSTNPLEKVEYYRADKAPDDAANNDLLSLVSNKPHPYWRIIRPGHCKVEVDDTTGKIISYINYDTLDANNDTPSGTAITDVRALKIAKSALQAADYSASDMALKGIFEQEGHNPPFASMHYIDVAWSRIYKGIPYRREGADVRLEAETGDVVFISIGLHSLSPTAGTENVSQTQAVTVAEAQLNAVNLFDLPLLEAKKEVVPFNNFWQSGDDVHHALQAYVAWNCHFGSSEDNFEVWVDAATGDVIGGSHEGVLGGSMKLLKPKFGHQLKHKELMVKGK